MESSRAIPEPWLRGTHMDVDAVVRQVLHALELTAEDSERWCAPLREEEMEARPYGLAPVAFHLRHVARSLDRLLSYAEGVQLDEAQLNALGSELEEQGSTRAGVLAELRSALEDAARRVRRFSPAQYNDARRVGRSGLPSTVGGLLVHIAEHTQRHTGQFVTTAKLLLAVREGQRSMETP